MKKFCVVIICTTILLSGISCKSGKTDLSKILIPVCRDGKWGFLNGKGQSVIDFQFQEAGPFSEGLARVNIANQWGYIDETGKLVIARQFEEAWSFAEGLAGIKLKNRYGFIDRTGKIVIEPQFIAARSFSEGLAPVAQTWEMGEPKWGYIDHSGQWVIRPKENMGTAFPFHEGLALVELKDVSTPYPFSMISGFIDKSGELIFTLPVKAGVLAEGLMPAKMGEKYGYIDEYGRMVIQAQFETAGTFSEGLAPVCLNDKFGYINPSGQIIIGLKFDWALPFSERLAAVQIAGKWGYVDQTGKMVIPPKFVKAWPFSEGLAPVQVTEMYYNSTGMLVGTIGYIDQSGKVVIEPRYILAGPFKKGQALVSIGKNSSGIIDKEGNPVESSQIATPPAPIPPPIPPLYSLASAEEKRRFYGQYYAHHVESEAFFFSGSLACVRIGNKYGFMDKTGAIVIPLKYEKAYPFSEGLAAVSINGQWGFIDTKGEEVIAPQFEFAENFSEGLAAVEKNGKWGYIDRKGKLLIDPIFRSAGSFENGLARVFTQDSSGLIDQKGKQIALEDYSDCEISKTDGYGITKEESERGELGVEEGIEGGVVGGVLGGVVGDVLGDVVGDVEAPVRAVGEIRPPKLLKSVAPDYPEAAREAGIEGVVILEATTDIYGRVVSCKVLKSIPILDQAAIDAVRQWVYEPLIIHNKPRGVKFTVTLRFTLK